MEVLTALTNFGNDISEGPPVEARRKQYEYYRDKLLTFKEAGMNQYNIVATDNESTVLVEYTPDIPS